ncbi:hypothetical protein HPB47_000417 [Ixodes persulcatus]|uniref:Uncharacterized protein n=1 Tax=Ixodes persulcatus TaxID=34615 RepID=A0AC60PRR7_IXOPE|nr:hypothetical protein HPB47_000417 [Ixodes persulcatus]
MEKRVPLTIHRAPEFTVQRLWRPLGREHGHGAGVPPSLFVTSSLAGRGLLSSMPYSTSLVASVRTDDVTVGLSALGPHRRLSEGVRAEEADVVGQTERLDRQEERGAPVSVAFARRSVPGAPVATLDSMTRKREY